MRRHARSVASLLALLPCLVAGPRGRLHADAPTGYEADLRAAREALSAAEAAHGPGSAEVAAALEEVAEALIAMPGPPAAEAEARARRALGIRRGEGTPSLLPRSLLVLARAIARRGSHDEAAPLIEEALALCEAARDDICIGWALHELASVQVNRSDYEAARATAERAVELRRSTLGEDHVATGESLDVLGGALLFLGQYDRAEEVLRQGLSVLESRLGSQDSRVGTTLTQLGTVAWFKGNYVEAGARYERALAVMEKSRGPRDPAVARILINLGNVAVQRGDYSRGPALHERALGILEEAYGPEHPLVGTVLLNLGATRDMAGEARLAAATYRRALEILERNDPEHHHVATLLLNMGALAYKLRDFDGALPLLERSLAIAERRLGLDNPDLALQVSDLASLQFELGHVGEARSLAERSLALRGSPPVKAQSLRVLAKIALRQGDTARARGLVVDALDAVERSLGPEHPETAWGHELLGEVASRLGDAVAALRHHRRALAVREAALGSSHPFVADSLRHLASILARDEASTGAALDHALRAEAVTREHLRETARGIAERQALTYALGRTSGLDWALTLLAARRPEALRRSREVLDAVVRSRCLVLDEMVARGRGLAASDDGETRRLLDDLKAVRTRWAWLTLQEDMSPEQRQALDSTRLERDRLEEALAQVSAAFRRDREQSRVGLDEIQRTLAPDAALVSFVHFRRQPLVNGGTEAVPAYLAFVLHADGLAVVPLAAAEEIDGLIGRWRSSILAESRSGGRARRRNLRDYLEVATRLRRSIWDPVAAQLRGARLVFVTADGALHRVAWGSLPTEGGRFLAETGPWTHLLSAERDLASEPAPLAGRGLLAVGAPDFDTAPAPTPTRAAAIRGAALGPGDPCLGLRVRRFSPLPGTGEEVREVGDLWRRGGSGGEVLSLLGPGAGEAALREHAPGNAVLHIATHGVFLGDCSADEPPRGGPVAAQLGSALILAGANRREAASGLEDGLLTAEEVPTLDLRGVRWVVLSACDTGMGDAEPGEGVFGLRRAFQVAGAETVIASLWPVEDASTRLFMRRLYGEWRGQGLSTTEAVRRATLAALEVARQAGRPHPFYWAGFVAVGSWR